MKTPSQVVVTSDRLGHDTVANRMFPKVRSWFALGAPLELLSPLSVARILALVAAVTWGLGGALGIWEPVTAIGLFVLTVATVAGLMRVRALSNDGALATLAVILLVAAATIGVSDHEQRVIALAPLLAFTSIFNGLFFRSSRLLAAAAAPCVVVIAVTFTTKSSMGVGDGVTSSLFFLGLTAMTAFTARTSRISGTIDADTGVTNLRGMTAHLADRSVEHDSVVATIHLSGVSEVRDALGHDAGTELVRRAVEDLGQVLPSEARIGRAAADDVVVVVENDPQFTRSNSDVIAETVRQIDTAVGSGRYLVGDIEVTLSTHVGIAVATSDGDGSDPSEVMRHSALAAHTARTGGKLFSEWDGASTNLTAEDLAILADLRVAIERGELWIAYQPQVRASDGRTVAVEALLRWASATRGNIPPGRFIPLAERTGFVDRLTDWVVAESLDAQVRWRAAGLDLTVSVNVSPLSLRSVDFGERVRSELAARDLPPQILMLEVTESTAFDIPEAVERLGPLRDLGVQISIDDFGTGYTSLAVLPHLPLDELKVDQQFIRNAHESEASRAIAVSVCELAHRLGLSAVAEGVEDAELSDLMVSFGFDLLQGYHFAKPLAEADLVVRMTAQAAADRLAPPTEPIAGTIGQHLMDSEAR